MNTYSEPNPCSSSETKPSLSSLKTYFIAGREYLSSGTFVKLRGCGSLVFEIISVVDQTEVSPPPDIITRSSLVTPSQIIKLGVYEICDRRNYETYRFTPLRQRALNGVTEVLKKNQTSFALNVDIESISFIFHSSTILSGENICSGISNAYTIRYEVNEHNRNVILPISPEAFMSFPPCYSEFSQYYATDYSQQVWTGISKMRETINSLMCRRTMTQGISFLTSKTQAFHSPLSLWSYIKSRLEGTVVVVHQYTRRSRKTVLHDGLAMESIGRMKHWEHIRFETKEDFDYLKGLVGENILYGVEKQRLTKRTRYFSALHENNTCHIIRPVAERTSFATRSPFNHGIDLLFNDIDGMKIYCRYSAGRAGDIPEVNAILHQSQEEVLNSAVQQDLIDNATLDDVVITPNRTTFSYLMCVWKVVEVDNNFLRCKVLQSRNDTFTRGSIYKINDINMVKSSILQMTRRN